MAVSALLLGSPAGAISGNIQITVPVQNATVTGNSVSVYARGSSMDPPEYWWYVRDFTFDGQPATYTSAGAIWVSGGSFSERLILTWNTTTAPNKRAPIQVRIGPGASGPGVLSNQVTVTVDNADYTITVSAAPPGVCVDGGTSTVTATVTNNGSGVSGHSISFSTSGPGSPGYCDPNPVNTLANGKAETRYYSGANLGSVTITATDTTPDPHQSATCSVTVFGGDIECLDWCCADHVCSEPGKWLLLVCAGADPVLESYQAKPGQPAGTTYKWQIVTGATKAHIEGSDTGDSVTLKADAEGNLTLQLTYTNGGRTCVEQLPTKVQKPNQANSLWQCYGRNFWCPDPMDPYPIMWAELWVDYYVRDADNKPVPHAKWDESWGGGGCGLPPDGWDIYTNCDGIATDRFYLWKPLYCDQAGLLCSQHQTIKVAGCPEQGYFWERDAGLMDGAWPLYPYVWHSGCANPW